MALSVCEYPHCKKLTLTKRCHEHPVEEGETDDELDKRLTTLLIPKETTMAKCTKASCPNEAAADSVRCPKHRDAQRASNAKFQGRPVPAGTQPKRTYTRRSQQVGETPSNAVATIEPPVVSATPVRRMGLNGNVLTILDTFIEKYVTDLATLRGAKEILERAP